MGRINLMLIDKNMNTFEVNIPDFMLSALNYDPQLVKPHSSKKDLNAEVSQFLSKHNQ